jgi:ABC-type bacteriocin/lantibiotic exporter with double-glycine peptidase domain
MNLIKIFNLTALITFLFSCSNKTVGKNINQENIAENNYYQTFTQQDFNKVEMIYSMEYYKNEIIKYQDNYYGFKDVSMEITDLMNFSSITELNNIIPDSLTFLVI